uniref:Uncharacterized protein n=1 Tax=Anas platyrhynchos platyrhynchos TaxID=8840 RepID=A0A493SUG0_ANAPP
MAAVGECSLPAPWRPLSLTHVEYPAGDFSGQLLAYLSLGPIFIIVGFVTLIIFKRELHTVSPPLPSSFSFEHKSFHLWLAAPVFTLLFVLKSQLREGDLLSAAGDPVTCNRFHL